MTIEAKLTPADDYRDRLIAAIDGASERVLLETMALDSIGDMELVLDSLSRARKRGAKTLLIYDRYAYLDTTIEQGVGATRSLKRDLERLEADGVELLKVGAIEANPFAGRHHVKSAVADDTVFAAGGINLTDSSFETHDFMFEFQDSQLADRLFSDLPDLARDRPEYEVIPVDEESSLILDGGVKGRSAILEAAQDLVTRAEAIWYVSKLAPDKDLLRTMQDKPTKYWFNSFGSAGGFDKLALLIDNFKTKLDNNYQGQATLHAKFIVGQMADGSLEAVTGSHNFNSRGVNFGTQELALQTRNQAICQQLLDFTKTL